MASPALSSFDGSELRLATKGLTEESLLNIFQKVAANVGLTVNFESGSQITIQVYMPGTIMAEQSTHTTKTGDITGSIVGSIGSAGDVTVFQNQVENSSITAEEKNALLEARRKLETLDLKPRDKKDVSEALDKVVEELQATPPDEGRLKRIFRNIKELAPPIATALSMAASLHKLMA